MREVRRLLGFVRPYARQALLALVLLATLVGLELAIPRLVQRIIDLGIRRNDRGVVGGTALLMLGISAVSTVIAIGNNVFSVRTGEGVARDLREALFVAIQRLSFRDLDEKKTGELLVRLTSDVSQVKALTQVSLRIGTRAPLLMIGSVILMFTTNPSLALAILPLLVVTSLLIAFFVVRMEPLFRRVQERLDALNTVLQENVAGARVVKALVRAEHEAGRFELANEAMTRQSLRVLRIMSTMTPALTMCVNVGIVIVIEVGGRRAIDGELSLGQIVAFTNYLLTTMTPLVMMSMLSNVWASGLASLRRVGDVLDTEPRVRDAADARPLPTRDAGGQDVTFDDVSFAYAAAEPVLEGVTLAAAPGKTIAILGATGSGKSTLVSLIPRFYDVTSGHVRVGGADVRDVTHGSLLEHVGFVPQQALLFSGTIRDNVRYGRPDASEEDVVRAAKAAQADEFVSKLAHGYDSRVEQRGGNLSGGQKQRLAIARALLVDPDILVLDDATSAVDVETETKIQRALAERRTGRTTFVVAQRISTVLDADVIVVLERGRIVARGTHRELLASSPVYREIYESQLGGGPA